MDHVLQVETLTIELLLIASLVAIAVRRLRVPYTVALVVVGLLITLGQELQVELTSELLLALFVPPLVFEAAFHLSFAALRRSLSTVLLLAVPGVVLTALAVGSIVAWATSLSLGAALVFGALIAATDPVAVVALFRTLGVPNRLAVLVESESLFNDGTSIVVFGLVLSGALSGRFDPVAGVTQFVLVSAGGIVVGLGLGAAAAWLISRVDDYLIETTLTTVLAFGAYIVAERLHVSGVLAVVTAGLVCGNAGLRAMSPTTRIVLFSFWEYVAFLANSLVFLLIGLDQSIPVLVGAWRAILAGVVAVLASRALVVYGLSWIANRLFEPVPVPFQHILVWGGLRGAVSLALALSLPVELGPERGLVRVMAFGVVLFTLLVQGTTNRYLVERLGLTGMTEARRAYEVAHARLTAARAAEDHLERLYREGSLSSHVWETLSPTLRADVQALADQARAILAANPSIEAEELDTARREILRAQRSALQNLQRDGVIADDVYEQLAGEIDAALEERIQPTEPDEAAAEIPPAETWLGRAVDPAASEQPSGEVRAEARDGEAAPAHPPDRAQPVPGEESAHNDDRARAGRND